MLSKLINISFKEHGVNRREPSLYLYNNHMICMELLHGCLMSTKDSVLQMYQKIFIVYHLELKLQYTQCSLLPWMNMQVLQETHPAVANTHPILFILKVQEVGVEGQDSDIWTWTAKYLCLYSSYSIFLQNTPIPSLQKGQTPPKSVLDMTLNNLVVRLLMGLPTRLGQ